MHHTEKRNVKNTNCWYFSQAATVAAKEYANTKRGGGQNKPVRVSRTGRRKSAPVNKARQTGVSQPGHLGFAHCMRAGTTPEESRIETRQSQTTPSRKYTQ